jgi:hypothetical protein
MLVPTMAPSNTTKSIKIIPIITFLFLLFILSPLHFILQFFQKRKGLI